MFPKLRRGKCPEPWGDIYNTYIAKGFDPGMAAFQADQWEKRQPKPMEHIASPDCWCEPEQDHIEPDVWIHRERH